MKSSYDRFLSSKALALCVLFAAALPTVQRAEARDIAVVRVKGTVTGDPRNATPTTQEVFNSLWGAGYKACKARNGATKSIALRRVAVPQGSLTGKWDNVVAEWACRDTP